MSVPERCGPYRLLHPIGVGAMAEVFVARGPTADGGEALFALKRLLPQLAEERDAVRMFEDEARLASNLIHPNVCRVFGLEFHGELPFQVMEWIDGVSLRWLVDASLATGGLPVDVVARIGIDVADALDYAHLLRDARGRGLGVVHRDVSPPNVMVAFDGTVKLLDFGLAKARTQLQKTRPGFVKGKFGYIAPEQLAGLYDVRTDVFQLGLCLYETLTGERLFPNEPVAAAVAAVGAYDRPPALRDRRPDLSAELEAVVRRALERSPDARFSTAAELREALRLAVGGDVADSDRTAMVVEMLLPDDARPSDEESSAAAAVDLPDEPQETGTLFWVVLSILFLAAGFVATAIYLLVA